MGIYDLPAARLDAMYRLSVTRNPRQTLVVAHGGEIAIETAWAGAVTYCSVAELVARDSPLQADTFDVAIVHVPEIAQGDNSPVGSLAAMQAVINAVNRLLRPGGCIAGQLPNRFRIDSWLSRLPASGGPHGFTASGCRKLLRSGGFGDVEIYVVLPSADAPEAVINVEPGSSRVFFADSLETSREDLTAPAYWLRRGLIRTGVYGKLVGSFLFKGRKPC